jgi:hypothetical protein
MKLNAAEFAHVRSQGLYITEKCDGCRKLLNQTRRYTIAGRQEVYCSAVCRDTVFFGDPHQAKKQATPGKCSYCGGCLKGKRRGALFCDEICKKRLARKTGHNSTAEVQLSGTPAQSNQRVAEVKTGEQGNRIAGVPRRVRNALGRVSAKFGTPVEAEQPISGSRGS